MESKSFRKLVDDDGKEYVFSCEKFNNAISQNTKINYKFKTAVKYPNLVFMRIFTTNYIYPFTPSKTGCEEGMGRV